MEEALKSIASGLTEGQKITLQGLGTFYTLEKPERPGRNPRTGQQTTFRASRKPKFDFDDDFVKQIDYGSPETPAPSPAPTPAPAPVTAPASLVSAAAPVTAPVLPPPIPPELIAASASPSKWQIQAPNGSFVEISTSQFADWGIGVNTPIYSVATGWKLAGQVPELVGIVK